MISGICVVVDIIRQIEEHRLTLVALMILAHFYRISSHWHCGPGQPSSASLKDGFEILIHIREGSWGAIRGIKELVKHPSFPIKRLARSSGHEQEHLPRVFHSRVSIQEESREGFGGGWKARAAAIVQMYRMVLSMTVGLHPPNMTLTSWRC